MTNLPFRHYHWRSISLYVLLFLLVLGVLWRIIQLNIFDKSFLQTQGAMRSVRIVSIPAYRGMIMDRHQKPLAISSPVYAVWIDPHNFQIDHKQLDQLSGLLGISSKKLTQRIKQHQNRSFVYLKRQLPPNRLEQIMKMALPGLFFQREFKRYYPEGEVMAHVIGFTNIDDHGQEGLELQYDHWLEGIPGSKRVLKDRLGRIVNDIDIIRAPRPGHNLVLSIDRRVQYLCYRILKQALRKYGAASGSIVVLSVGSGEILAMVNAPSFNPNNHGKIVTELFRNRAVTDIFEPGSTLKALSVANLLQNGHYNSHSLVDTSPGWIRVSDHRIDDDGRNLGVIDLSTVLKRSSNVGISKLTLTLSTQTLPSLLKQMGFGMRSASAFPGESPGLLPNRILWPDFSLATLSFGYGISVTTLQLAQAYAIIASGGNKYPLTFLKRHHTIEGQAVLKPKVAQQLMMMLQQVVEGDGTARLARVPGYHVGGKTGTVRIVGPQGYEKDHHNAIFVGMAPIHDPKLVVAVYIHDPKGRRFYGGQVAAPIFSQVMGGVLRLLDIPPDNLA